MPEVTAKTTDELRKQVNDGTLIQNFITNTRKMGADKLNLPVWQARQKLLDSYWERVADRHQYLSAYEEPLKERSYFRLDYYQEYEWAYSVAQGEIEREIEMLRSAAAINASLPSSPSHADQGQSHASYHGLPKIDLPKFSGNLLEWETFKEMFLSMVYNERSIPAVKKLQYLMHSLEGDAAKRLKNTHITGANLEPAWTAIKRRYDNHRILFQAHIENLLSLPVAKTRSVEDIQRILDVVEEARRACKNLGRPVDTWDDWYVGILICKLDQATRELWETSLTSSTEFPQWETLVTFLETRIRGLETAHGAEKTRAGKAQDSQSKAKLSTSSNVATKKGKSKVTCISCKADHIISFCPQFKELSPHERKERAFQLQLCLNCLRAGHAAADCPGTATCLVCGAKHHTLLHRDASGSMDSSKTGPSTPRQTTGHTASSGRTVLFATAYVTLQSPTGEALRVRALLDPASEESYISEHTAQTLNLKRRPIALVIAGVGAGVSATSKAEVDLTLKSPIQTEFSLSFTAFVLNRLTGLVPAEPTACTSWPLLNGLVLADPDFGRPARIDCILGAEIYATVLRRGVRVGLPKTPAAMETVFGWVIVGSAQSAVKDRTSTRQAHCLHATRLETISDKLQRQWELEELRPGPHFSPAEQKCLDFYESTHSRDQSGRFTVRFPFSTPDSYFPGSRSIAVKCFMRMEKKLISNPALAASYRNFMDLYSGLHHMEEIDDPDAAQDDNVYYLPHHAVFKNDDSGAIRVVFNASQKAANGVALNDCLLSGPKLQTDLWIILTRWRFYEVAFTTDIVKMFRQVKIAAQDTDWQRIVWRSSPELPLKDYRLLTVTYGTSFAPFAAIWVLLKLADLEAATYPTGASLLRRNTYVDDILGGGDNLEEAMDACADLTGILKTAGLSLSKWAATHPSLTPSDSAGVCTGQLIDLDQEVSTLGLKWSPSNDVFRFKIHLPEPTEVVTKRTVLSELAQLFDPLGLLAPVLITGKILLQNLWITGVDWDTTITEEGRQTWLRFREDLEKLEGLQIPRWLQTHSTSTWQLHGFADASERAYAAVAYLVVNKPDGTIRVSILAARSRVAPVKTVSLPKLELCGAVLLGKLLHATITQVGSSPESINCWSDSRVVLAWLSGHPSRWKPFVANRVGEILTTLPTATWRHVRSRDNPADCATRGFSTDELAASTLWWSDPTWLAQDPSEWPTAAEDPPVQIPEARVTNAAVAVIPNTVNTWLSQFSTIDKPLRILACIFRWLRYAKRPEGLPREGYSTATDRHRAKVAVCRAAQRDSFKPELDALRKGHKLPGSSQLRRLSPFVDERDGLLRVGGRLQNEFLVYEEKHPIILPKDQWISTLLARQAHVIALHGGLQLTWSLLIRSTWILRGRNLVRSIVSRCVRCARFSAQPVVQRMAPLPAVRVSLDRPFMHTGVDYAGPFQIRTSPGRGHTSYKGYVALFVCMATRAVHIEVVSNLTTDAFLATFKRFISRRGLCAKIFSDNGTNFVGASAELRRLFQMNSEFQKTVAQGVAAHGVEWHFNPPRAPHHGGLWEAAVKSFKHHLKRVVGEARLTYEEFSTLAAQIECCLNSRPLGELSSDPADVAALTPGHLLIGTALTALPDPSYSHVSEKHSHASRWQMIGQMRNHFWKRWSADYKQRLYQKGKWQHEVPDVKVGALVLVLDELQPPTRWALARVIATHPGKDHATRVVTVRTASSEFQRPITKIALLPVHTDDRPEE